MSLLQPGSLLWLLLIPPIVLLYLLKLQRQERLVSSVLFWWRAVQDWQANAPLQKLRRNLLLLLQILLIILTALALARPYVVVPGLGGRRALVILDGSASMKSREGGKTRFDRAREVALRMVQTMGQGEEMMLLLATSRTEVVTPLTSDRSLLRRRLRDLTPADTPTNLQDALRLALALAQSQPDSLIYLLSDGAVPPETEVSLGPAEVQFLPFGERHENVGLTAFAARRSFGPQAHWQVLLTVGNFGTRPATVEVELYHEDTLLDLRPLTVPAGERRSLIFDNLGVEAGLLRAQLEVEDDLTVDNVAYVSLGGRRERKVLFVGEGNLFWETALGLDPDLALVRAAAEDVGRLDLDEYEVVIFNGAVPNSLREGGKPNYVFLNCDGPGCPATIGGEVQAPTILDWNREHPVTAYLGWSPVHLARARRAEVAPWGEVLVEAEETPLVVVGERGSRRVLYFGFDLNDSDLPLRATFPILVANLMAWLTEPQAGTELPAVRAGEPATLELPTEGGMVRVRRPDGRLVTRPARMPFTFAETDRVGVYTVTAGEERRRFAVSLLSAAESNTAPRRTLTFGPQRLPAAKVQTTRRRELWRPFVVVALLLLALEWWWYHRRG